MRMRVDHSRKKRDHRRKELLQCGSDSHCCLAVRRKVALHKPFNSNHRHFKRQLPKQLEYKDVFSIGGKNNSTSSVFDDINNVRLPSLAPSFPFFSLSLGAHPSPVSDRSRHVIKGESQKIRDGCLLFIRANKGSIRRHEHSKSLHYLEKRWRGIN